MRHLLSSKHIRRATAVALLCTLTACATGTIRLPDGTTVHGTAIGQAVVSACIAPILDVGPSLPVCARIEGGALSDVFGGLVSGAITATLSAAAAYFSGGAL